MQKIDKDTLIKSLSINMYIPRDVNDYLKDGYLRFSTDLNDDNSAFISDNLDEIGYARRYVNKLLFYKLENCSEEELIKASIYGADGLLISNAKDSKLVKGIGLYTAIKANNNFDLLKASLNNIDIVITTVDLAKTLSKNKIKGLLCNI